ncbi:GxxExxY protein [Geminisphaera colitermitum]|uniref:GxxExxY protein n=1 Tax=Geminisphaera colitermitum TaxID=1148786 RepID=UPI000158D3FB|nr:GxxExxY protein [Geminisphaera colitermitum]
MQTSRRDAETQSENALNHISGQIVDAAYRIHSRLGPGLLESVYETILSRELAQLNLKVERQKPIPIEWDDLRFDEGFRADLVVNDCIVVELKSAETLAPVHSKQLLTYLRLLDYRLGLLINFGAPLIKDGIKRIANNLSSSASPQLCASASLRDTN